MPNLSSDALTIIGILLSIIVALVFFILGLRAGRPKLIAGGSGSGTIHVPNKDIMATNITIYNQPTFWGMKVNRGTARIDSARLYDPEIKEYIGPVLLWQKDGSQELERECLIEPGKNKGLYLFAKERYSKEYFILSGKSLNSELDRPTVTYEDLKKDFSVHLFDAIGHRYRFDIIARNEDQSVGVRYKVTWHTRWNLILEAFSLLRQAFSPGPN